MYGHLTDLGTSHLRVLYVFQSECIPSVRFLPLSRTIVHPLPCPLAGLRNLAPFVQRVRSVVAPTVFPCLPNEPTSPPCCILRQGTSRRARPSYTAPSPPAAFGLSERTTCIEHSASRTRLNIRFADSSPSRVYHTWRSSVSRHRHHCSHHRRPLLTPSLRNPRVHSLTVVQRRRSCSVQSRAS